jgi:hypothetical protein
MSGTDSRKEGSQMKHGTQLVSRLGCYLDRKLLSLALFAFWWARGVIATVRARRGRDFLSRECDIIDRRPGVYTELDQAEDRRRALAMDLGQEKEPRE